MEIVKHLLMTSVMFLMLGVGLRTPFRQVIDITKQFRAVMRGVLANFLIVPLLFYLTVEVLPFTPEVGIGLMIMAAVPIAPLAPPFVVMARGDVPYAVGLMAVVALLCVPFTPLILSLCLPKNEAGLELDVSRIIETLLIAQLIPIGAGMAVNQFRPTWSEKLLRFVPTIGQIGLLISTVLLIYMQDKLIIELGVLPNLTAVLLLITCLVIGELMMVGESVGRRRSLGISTAIRNVALGLLIVNSNYPGTQAVAMVLVFGVLSLIIALGYAKMR